MLPADILGQVYEQFLGKVIRLTAGHRAVVEDKPEVRKAGGVFYTPDLHRGIHRAANPGQAVGGHDAAPGRGHGSPGWAQGMAHPGPGYGLRLRLLPDWAPTSICWIGTWPVPG